MIMILTFVSQCNSQFKQFSVCYECYKYHTHMNVITVYILFYSLFVLNLFSYFVMEIEHQMSAQFIPLIRTPMRRMLPTVKDN